MVQVVNALDIIIIIIKGSVVKWNEDTGNHKAAERDENKQNETRRWWGKFMNEQIRNHGLCSNFLAVWCRAINDRSYAKRKDWIVGYTDGCRRCSTVRNAGKLSHESNKSVVENTGPEAEEREANTSRSEQTVSSKKRNIREHRYWECGGTSCFREAQSLT